MYCNLGFNFVALIIISVGTADKGRAGCVCRCSFFFFFVFLSGADDHNLLLTPNHDLNDSLQLLV